MILDTNALSAFIDGEPAVGVCLSADGHASIPVIVLGEFRYGITGSRHRDKYEQWLEDHLPDFEILSVTEPTTVTYARLRTSLKNSAVRSQRTTRGLPRSALQHGLPV